MENLRELLDATEGIRNPLLADWKQRGKPVVGYVCSYIPREVLHAAGVLPLRIGATGCETTGQADAWMAPITCSFSRSCLELALTGQYAFLDGLVSMNTCECMRRMCDNWRHAAPVPYSYFLSVPFKSDRRAIEWYKEEIRLFLKSLNAAFGNAATEEDLDRSIAFCNETRRLLRVFHDLRARSDCPLTGSDAQRATLLAWGTPPEEYNRLLARWIEDLQGTRSIPDNSPRLLLIGTTVDDVRLTERIESLGGRVVADVSCFGAFSFWDPLPDGSDPLERIARGYLSRPTCPRMASSATARRDLVRDLFLRFRADGIVFERMLYCNLWGGETLSLERDLKELGFPFLILDREYAPGGTGQLRTRLQAFFEMIRGV